MTSFFSRTAATRDDWQTPRHIISALGHFDLDPCANNDDPTRCGSTGFTIEQDGLSREWHGRVWLNPPYGGATPAKVWLMKLARHGNGVALVPPRVGARWFHDVVLSTAHAILFLKGRVSFIDPVAQRPARGNNADSILIAYGLENVVAFEKCGLEGRLWRLLP
ncbi:DNA N-6-adenine-methyltransferase [Sphingobium sp. DEHP117]|uniref:DNA N-6-adenine-methyltransferase n=1 Tax=Sphingobium sp. DEHP117 TaxID=2993436 RepID=UPI0027D4EA85|nr:DNA N-6-adenine-methyltransferase [Sphingobium sp. DEHP117]MDQ4421225.1 DNA N-6-adenine-methyltransferase [Sphingobium sp. DEHP117]